MAPLLLILVLPATGVGGVLMRVGLVDCGSIPRTACELRSFSFIERRMLCWVGRAVRFRRVFGDSAVGERSKNSAEPALSNSAGCVCLALTKARKRMEKVS